MKLYNYISKSIYIFIAAVSTLLLASCGSYQYTGTSNDGVYGDNEIIVSEKPEYGDREENSDYYKKLFEEEAALYGEVLAEDAVFTDVDSYSSTRNYDYDNQNTDYQGGNAPWGNSPDSYSINIYNNGFYGGFYPYWGRGYYAYDPFWGPSPYYGFYGPSYYPYGYGFGFGRGYYDYGFGFGFSIYPRIYGGGVWYNPYNHYAARHHYFRQNVAYNTGRRGANSYSNNRTSAIRNATNLNNRGRSSTYSRSIRNIRNSNDEYGITRRTSSRSYNPDGQYSRSRRSSSRVSTPSRRSNSTYSNSNRSTSRSTSPAVRSSRSSSRSSGTVRSSSSSSRSSSTSRSSSRGNRGRNN